MTVLRPQQLRFALRVLRRAVVLWQTQGVPRLGAALAFYTVLSLAPLLIVAVGVMGLFLSQSDVQSAILAQVQLLVGPDNRAVLRLLRSVFTNVFSVYQTRTGVITSLVGTAGLLFGASLVLLELRAALNHVWGVEAAASRRESVLTFLKNRAISLLMVLGVGLLLLVLLLFTTALDTGDAYLRAQAVPVAWLQRLEAVLGFALLTLFLALSYKVLPAVRVRWREVWPGALVAALLLSAGRWLVGAYVATSALTSVYEAAGSLVVLLLWVHYSAQMFFFGAAMGRAQREVARAALVVSGVVSAGVSAGVSADAAQAEASSAAPSRAGHRGAGGSPG